MVNKAAIEELMLELFTDPERPLALRLPAARFFLRHLQSGVLFVTVKIDELIEQCQIIVRESIEYSKEEKQLHKDFCHILVEIIGAAYVYVEAEAVTATEVSQVLGNLLQAVGSNAADPDMNYLLTTYPALVPVLHECKKLLLALHEKSEYTGVYIPPVE